MSTRICAITRLPRTGIPVWPGEAGHREARTWRLTKDCPANVSTFTLSAGTGTPANGPLHYATAGLPIGAVTPDTSAVHAIQREVS